MPASFLHGIETLTLNDGPVPVTIVKSGVIGLVGIAPAGPKNLLVEVNGVNDAAQFGSPVPGFNIPQALKQILAQGAGSILVVNVFDATSHTTAVSLETQTPTSGKLKLSFAPIGTISVFANDGTTPSTLVRDQDYSIDAYGNFQALTANVVNGTPLKFTYNKLNATAITSSVIIGSYNSSTGVRTGFQCFGQAKNQFGYDAKIFISPGYSSVSAVATEMIAQADKYRAIALLDAPYGTTVSGAIAGRGIGGSINFNTSSKRAILLYPYLKAYDPASNSNIDFPYSAFYAGVMSATDNNFGFWYSPSNKEIKGVVGAERNISAGVSDANSDANLLNAAGITTIFNTFGTGIRTWSNRSAAYPTYTTPDNFVSVQRTADVIHESLSYALLQFIDLPVNPALLDAIRESANSFIRVLIMRGALIEGSKVTFPADANTPQLIATGQITYDLTIMPPVPAERIELRSFIDINLLQNLIPNN